MKRTLPFCSLFGVIWLLFLSIFIPVSAESTVIISEGDATLQELNPLPEDTVVVASGHTVTIDGNWQAGINDTTCLIMYVREGGVLRWSGNARANFGALWLGGRDYWPFESPGGGEMYLGASDTLGLWNTNIIDGADFQFRGDNCTVNINGGASTSRAVIMGMSSSSRPYIYTGQTSGRFFADYAKFYRLGEGFAYCGITFNPYSSRSGASQRFDHCVFDSACIRLIAEGAKIANCSLYTYPGYYDPVMFEDGDGTASHDTVWNCYIECNNINEPSITYIYGVGIEVDSCVIYGTTIRTTNVNGDAGRANLGIGFKENIIHTCLIRRDTLEGFHHNIASMSSGAVDVLIDSSVIRYATHENIILQEAADDSAWTFQNNVFYGGGWEDGGYADLLFDKTASKYVDMKILYNTFCNSDTGDIALEFRNHGGSSDIVLSGFSIVGNIFIGGYDWHVKVHNSGSGIIDVICNDFKHNAYDFISVTGGNGITVADDAYLIESDSNFYGLTMYGFVDSVNFDFRLAAGSPLINAGDSAYGCEVYYGDSCGWAPFNIGSYQGYGVGAVDIIPELYIDSIRNDFEDEIDSVAIRYLTAERIWGDSVVFAFSTIAYPDSNSTERVALAYQTDLIDTVIQKININESDFLFVSAWVRSEAGDWSERVNESRLFVDLTTGINESGREEYPEAFFLNCCYPNPFNSATTIEFSLPVKSHAEISIFNILGRKITTLVNDEYRPGRYEVVWNGTDSGGKSVSSGVYLCRFNSNRYAETKKLIILK